MSEPSKYDVGPSEWVIILSDWKRSDADVEVHLRSGQTLGPGKVTRLPGGDAIGSGELTRREGRTGLGYGSEPERRWTFDAREIVAITATAAR